MANVFIGIPTINRPEFVRHTIKSVLAQSYCDYKVIVSDNGSGDSVRSSIKQFIDDLGDSRISFYGQPQNNGEYGQGRYFLEQSANAEYFMILHDDDLLSQNYLQEAVNILDQNLDCALFVADAYVIDEKSVTSEAETKKYLAEHGRLRQNQGRFDILRNHLANGFAPVSGTLFRKSELVRSGFVNSESIGNYPFESDIFLRLGDISAKGWFCPRQLISFRFHSGSMRNYINLLDNEKAVNSMIALFDPRRYQGEVEEMRKKHLGCLYRAKALLAARKHMTAESRTSILRSIKSNVYSMKTWMLAPLIYLLPGFLAHMLPKIPEIREAPTLDNNQYGSH